MAFKIHNALKARNRTLLLSEIVLRQYHRIPHARTYTRLHTHTTVVAAIFLEEKPTNLLCKPLKPRQNIISKNVTAS